MPVYIRISSICFLKVLSQKSLTLDAGLVLPIFGFDMSFKSMGRFSLHPWSFSSYLSVEKTEPLEFPIVQIFLITQLWCTLPCSYVYCMCSVALVVSDSLQPHGSWPTRLLCPWDFPRKNTGVGCHAHLQEIFLSQRLNPRLLRLCIAGATGEDVYCISYKLAVVVCRQPWASAFINRSIAPIFALLLHILLQGPNFLCLSGHSHVG